MAQQPLRIEFVSDVACPWCAVGLWSLDRALERLGGEVPVELHFEPFELNPSMPPEGEDATEHLSRKYGAPPEQLGALARRASASAVPRSASRSATGRASGTRSPRIGCCTGRGSAGRRPVEAQARAARGLPLARREPERPQRAVASGPGTQGLTSSAPPRSSPPTSTRPTCAPASATGRSSASTRCRPRSSTGSTSSRRPAARSLRASPARIAAGALESGGPSRPARPRPLDMLIALSVLLGILGIVAGVGAFTALVRGAAAPLPVPGRSLAIVLLVAGSLLGARLARRAGHARADQRGDRRAHPRRADADRSATTRR